jgi:hypothetical protein
LTFVLLSTFVGLTLLAFALPSYAVGNTAVIIKNVTALPFVTYQNASEGIKIDYPKDWMLIKENGLTLLSPKTNYSDSFREGLMVSWGPVVNESIDIMANRLLKFYNSSLMNFHLIESKGIVFHGNPAHSLLYTFSLPRNGSIKALDFGTIENSRLQVFRYTAQENNFEPYLPIINRTIDSFNSIK